MTPDVDLVIVGAGPAGIAAAVMATSLGMRTRIVEPGPIGGKLHHIGALANVPGAWTTGPDLAKALEEDLARITASGLCRRTAGRVTSVAGHDTHAEAVLEDGTTLTAAAVVVATGVAALTPADVSWIDAPDDFVPAPLWRTTPAGMTRTTHVLGADRPLGTWLRAHPRAGHSLAVLCPPQDDYKALEVADDPRVTVIRCTGVSVSPASDGTHTLKVTHRDGEQRQYVASTVLNNLGSRPAALPGLEAGPDGYCPPAQQHPRILVVGDLRSTRFQRIVTAQGSGAQAALARYYEETVTA